MKYFILSGEASGDLHGSNLVIALKKEDPNAAFKSWGGDLIEKAGATVLKHYRDLAFMGFLEVVKNLPTILQNFKTCKKDILSFQPDVLILIDYPGFNLRMAKWAHKNNIRVFYYISPQLWAWNTGRAELIKRYVERMYVILPFEKDFYHKFNIDVDYAGHPLVDVINNYKPTINFYEKNNLNKNKPIVAMLPGSRKQEIKRMLGIMLSAIKHFPEHQFIIAGAPSIERSFYQEFLNKNQSIYFIENQTYDLLSHADAALVTSGTATLETALFNTPQVVCYSGNWFSYQLAKRLVNKDLKFISLANLIADQQVVKELIQENLTEIKLVEELNYCLSENGRSNILKGYKIIKQKLNLGGASESIAKLMVDRLRTLL
ncbi:MAG: lipid-A-disaccharide synthase [Saprospiraceae bacterium]